MISFKQFVAAAVLAAAPVATAHAQNYPSKPVTVTIGVPPGGALYNLLQAAGEEFKKMTGQPILIETKPGANTIIQMNACKAAAPDGYTLCIGSRSGITLNPFAYENLSYDPQKDFVAIAPYFTANHILLISNSIPAKDWKGVVEYAKANPNKINYGSWGAGGDSHLFIEWMAKQAGAKLTHIPYPGFGPSYHAFKAGENQMLYFLIGNPGVVADYKAGRSKIIMVSGDKRNPVIPEVPTMVEAGLPADIAAIRGWFGIFAPAGTPKEIVNKLNQVFTKILTGKELTEKFMRPNGFDYEPATPEQFAAFVAKDREIARKLVEVSGVKLKQNR